MNRLLKGINNETLTENGAITYKSTLNANLDYYATVAAARDRDTLQYFKNAYKEDPQLAMRNLFHLRDIRGGKGERATFRNHLVWLYTFEQNTFYSVLPLIPEYGRWDDVLKFWYDPLVVTLVQSTLLADVNTSKPTLLAKWMPSENASSKATKILAQNWMRVLEMSARDYRKMLSTLRKKIGIVETRMSAREWTAIKYDRVPSKAMTNYRKAFAKHDPSGFAAYMERVEKGETKINSATLFPHELYTKIVFRYDQVLEAQWKALPQYTDDKSFLVCPDVSGSMSGTPIAMSVSLAVYCSQYAKGAFKDHVLSFTDKPTLYDLSGCKHTYEKFYKVNEHVGYSTNLYDMFQEIVNTGKRYNVPQSDMPDYLLIITDMEFNDNQCGMTNLEAAQKLFKDVGYVAPIIVFWNVASRKANVGALDTGKRVILVSGASTAVIKNALAGNPLADTTPIEAMLEILNSERYTKIIV